MELRVFDSTQQLDYNFGLWLLPKVSVRLLANINKYNFLHWDTYLTESSSLADFRLYNKKYSAKDVVEFSAKNLISVSNKGNTVIKISEGITPPGFKTLDASYLAKLINYGTLDVPGTRIFTDVFSYFEKNIDMFVDFFYNNSY